MYTNAAVAAPRPASSSVITVVVVIATVQPPVAANCVPSSSCPPLVCSPSVEMAANPFVVTRPEPAWALVIVVSPPEVPVRSHPTPVPLVVPVEGPEAVKVHTNAPVPAPRPAVSSVKAVIVVISTVEAPVPADDNPARASPAVLDSETVQVSADAS
jgi:hypothetical protein